MSPGGLLRLFVSAPIISLAIAVSAQATPATTSDSASDPNVLINQSIIEMAAARTAGRNHHHENPNLEDELQPVNSRAG